MLNNGDTTRIFKVGKEEVRGLGSFHKTLPHNEYGEVIAKEFDQLVSACAGSGAQFVSVPKGTKDAANLTNPQAGLASDQLINHPASYSMPPAPRVLSETTAAEMTELYWMALLRDVPFSKFDSNKAAKEAAAELDSVFRQGISDQGDEGRLRTGVDVPGPLGRMTKITPQNLFRLGLPGEEVGPLVSQFFLRSASYGTQTVDQRQAPYKKGQDYLTNFTDWLNAQESGKGHDGSTYPTSNELDCGNFEKVPRYITTPRDLARFVNKDALHQAYFNAALVLLSGEAKWTPGNPYSDTGALRYREAGFGVLGGPHILALVSEVASRGLKAVWNQKWQVHLRLRPEAYGGLVHVQNVGAGDSNRKRAYGLPGWVAKTKAAARVRKEFGGLLLPMAFTAGSPTHPAYGAGHATVAGMCVTVLKAYFQTIDKNCEPIAFASLRERGGPCGTKSTIRMWSPELVEKAGVEHGELECLPDAVAEKLTIEGELNKLAMNVAMGRSMGGVHWRTDNTRSLMLGEALAARVLADIATDCNEAPEFTFRSFSRDAGGNPKRVHVRQGRVYVNDVLVDTNSSAL